MASVVANRLKYRMAVEYFTGKVFKLILMESGFTFNKDTHHGYADVSGSELPTANGYTAGGNTLGGISITENDVDDRTEVAWNNSTWNALGGPIGPTPCAIAYNDTDAGKDLVGEINFGGDQTEPDGGVATVANIKFYTK